MPTPAAISSTRGERALSSVNAPYGPSARTFVPGRSLATAALWSPRFLTVNRR